MTDSVQIKEAGKKSFKWSFFAELFAKIAIPISTMFLARILSPEIYGIATAVTMVITFCETVLENGFSKYLIQHDFKDEQEQRKAFNVLFWFSIFISLVTCLVIFLLRKQLSHLIGNDGYEMVLFVSGFQIPFASISALLATNLKRNFCFKKLFVVRIVYSLTPFIITLPLALMGAKEWSLIIGSLASQIFQCFALIIISKAKIGFSFSFSVLISVIKKSVPMIIESVIIWLCTWTSTLVATQFFDSHIVGLVKVSNSTVTSIFALFSTAFTSVLFPTLSRLKNDQEAFEDSFYLTQQAAICILLPIGIGCFFYSDLITSLMLGSKWAEASIIIAVFALTKPFNCCFNNFLSEAFRSKGHFYLSTFYQLFMLILDLTFKFTIGRISFQAFIMTNIVVDVIINLVAVIILKLYFKFSLKIQLKTIVPAFLSSLVMVPIIFANHSSSIVSDVLTIILSTITYFTFFWLFFPKQFKTVMEIAKIRPPKFIKNIFCDKKIPHISFERLKINKKKAIGIGMITLSFTSLFLFGSLNSDYRYEVVAQELSDISIKEDSQIWLKCVANDETNYFQYEAYSKKINDRFYEHKPLQMVIASKSNDKIFSVNEFDELGDNLILLPSSYFSNHVDSRGNIIFDRYYLQLMFKDSNTSRHSNGNFVYITKKQADYLIYSNNSYEKYSDLIDQTITFSICEGENVCAFNWKIANIFEESDFVSQAEKTLGNFIICGQYLPVEAKGNEFILFSFESNSFYNKNKLKTLQNIFDEKTVNFNFYDKSNSEQNNKIISKIDDLFSTQNSDYEWLYSLLLTLDVFLLATGFIFYIKGGHLITLDIILHIGIATIIWGIFKAVNYYSNSLLFFSSASLVLFLLFFICLTIIDLTIKRVISKNEN